MLSLEQVKLLESKVSGAIGYVNRVTGENRQLKERLDSYQKRIDGLEILIQDFKEEQSHIEDSILSALDLLNQFEDALETTVSRETPPVPPVKGGPAGDTGKAGKDGSQEEKKQGPAGEEPEPPAGGQETGSPAADGSELDIF